jgi:hypothetical protein
LAYVVSNDKEKMMKLTIVLSLILLLAGCGGKPADPSHPPGAGGIIDPSGNWNMTFNGSGRLAAMFHQEGVVVTAHSLTSGDNPLPFNCVPFEGSFSEGLVTGDQFTGRITIRHAVDFPVNMDRITESFTFTGTLTPNGEAVSSGTYIGMPACTGLPVTGSFIGGQVPAVTGSWTGTIQPCTFNQRDGSCSPFDVSSTFAAVLTQNDVTGNSPGTYQVGNLLGFTNGTILVEDNDQDILSGFVWQFTMVDANRSRFVVNGKLTQDRAFNGVVFGENDTTWLLTMRH